MTLNLQYIWKTENEGNLRRLVVLKMLLKKQKIKERENILLSKETGVGKMNRLYKH